MTRGPGHSYRAGDETRQELVQNELNVKLYLIIDGVVSKV